MDLKRHHISAFSGGMVIGTLQRTRRGSKAHVANSPSVKAGSRQSWAHGNLAVEHKDSPEGPAQGQEPQELRRESSESWVF